MLAIRRTSGRRGNRGVATSFGDGFKEHCQGFLGVRPSHVISAIQSYDRVETVGGEGATPVELYLKLVKRRDPPIYLLIQALRGAPPSEATSTISQDSAAKASVLQTRSGGQKDDIWVEAAWPIPASMLTPDTTPLEALELLTEHFGVFVEVGGVRKKLIISKTLPLADTGFSYQEGHVAALARFHRDPEKKLMRFSVVYAIDLDRLRAAT